MIGAVKRLVKRAVLGPPFPQQCSIGLREPQDEIVVDLDGAGPLRDVTQEHVLASAAPFTIALANVAPQPGLSLRFRERGGRGRWLARLDLEPDPDRADVGGVACFRVVGAANACLDPVRVRANELWWAWLRRRHPAGMAISRLDARAMAAYFVCPRAVALVGVETGQGVNLFPMNLMGPLGGGRFALALNTSRKAADQVRCAGRAAVSSVPFDRHEAVRSMGDQHLRDRVDQEELSFGLRPSERFGLPTPEFALKVLELEVESCADMGSHTLFVTQIAGEEVRGEGERFFMAHGLYQAWRVRKGRLAD